MIKRHLPSVENIVPGALGFVNVAWYIARYFVESG